MEWFKTYSNFWTHPKIRRLNANAFRVLMHSWGYSSEHGTDGRITPDDLRFLGGSAKESRALVDAGLWDVDGPDWVIHDWAEHQASAVKLEEQRVRDKERKRAARSKDTDALSGVDFPGPVSVECPRTVRGMSGPRREESRGEELQPPPTANVPLRAPAFLQVEGGEWE